MSELKYEEFYLISDNREHPLYTLQYISDEEYLHLYAGNIYCPSCKKAQLSRVRRKNIFLRTNHGQEHGNVNGEPCEYSFDRISTIETEKLIIDLKKANRLRQKLESVLLQLKKRRSLSGSSSPSSEEKRPMISKSNISGSKKTIRRITPKYSFLNWGITTPLNHLIIAYGLVYMTTRISQKGYKYLMLYENENKTRLLTSFLKPNNINIENGYYYIVAVGTCKQNGKYFNFELYDSYNGLYIESYNDEL